MAVETVNTLRKIEVKLNEAFMEREEEIHGLLLAALSGKNIFFIGPPGTAKTQMVRAFCDCIEGSDFFYWLLTRFSTPEELFGPVDLGALKTGSFRRITTGKMPESHVSFLDEVFKGNSAILNSLLSILQERIYHNDGAPMDCPLIFAVGASNELPEEDESLEALYDRFLIRYRVKYLREQDNFVSMLAGGGSVDNAPKITQAELQGARKEVADLPLAKDMNNALWDLRKTLRDEDLGVSDRRFVQALSVLRAEAWLRGDTEVKTDCIEVLGHILWNREEDINRVQGLCYKVSDPSLFRAKKIYEAAETAKDEILKAVTSEEGVDRQAEAIQVSSQLKKAAEDLDDLASKSPRISEMTKKVREWNREVIKKGVGLDV